MRLREAAAIIADFVRDRIAAVEGQLGDGRDEDRGIGAVADFDLAHEAEGIAGEHIGHRAKEPTLFFRLWEIRAGREFQLLTI